MFQLAVLVLAWIAPCTAFLRAFPVSNVRSRSSLSAIAANLAAPLVPPSPTVTAPDAYDWTFLDDVYLIITASALSPWLSLPHHHYPSRNPHRHRHTQH